MATISILIENTKNEKKLCAIIQRFDQALCVLVHLRLQFIIHV